MKRLVVICCCLFVTNVLFAQYEFYKSTPAAKRWVDSVYNSLTPQQRVAQLMVIRLSAKTPDKWVCFDSAVTKNIINYNVGSVCLFQGNPAEQAAYINRYQALAKTPLMFCIDGETGLGMRMYDSVMKLPDQLTIGAVNDSNLVYKIGTAMGEQCRRTGIQVDYAPVVDINNNPANPVIGYRSFGENKYKVALYGTKIMQGLQDMGIMACAKHFPGHGDVSVDSHFDLPVINKSMEQLDSLELYPFKRLFEAGVGSVMIAHLSVPAIDTTKNQPTSLSKKNVTDLLRNKLHFNGISFTDALEMQGVAKYYPGSAAGIQSLIAGNDMLCLPGDIPGTIKGVLDAVKKGKLNKADLEAKVKKVLLVKYNMGLQDVQPVQMEGLTHDLNKQVLHLRYETAKEAFTLLSYNYPQTLPLTSFSKIAYLNIGGDSDNALGQMLHEVYNADVYNFSYNDDAAKGSFIISSLKRYDIVITAFHGASKYPKNNFGVSYAAVALAKQVDENNNAVTMIFGNPYIASNFAGFQNLMVCYEDDATFQEAAFDWLAGKFAAKGTLPVTAGAFASGSGIQQPLTDNALPFSMPETQGMNSDVLQQIDSVANNAIAEHAIPGCVVLAVRNGHVVFDKAYGYFTYDSTTAVNTSTIYDLASVTKISATTVSVMQLYEQGLLDINKTLGDYLPWVKESDKAPLVIKDILLHQAGLDPFIPFYKELLDPATGQPLPGNFQPIWSDSFSIRVADKMYMRNDWVDTMYKRILQSKITQRGKYVYSDNDFIFLGKIVQQITGKPLEQYAAEHFYTPLHMSTTGFRPLLKQNASNIAPTEDEKFFRLQLLHGDVHDPGAAMFGGVAGHAGLFSDAYDLAKLYQMLLNGGVFDGRRYLQQSTIDTFTAYQSETSRRGLGFDKPEKDNNMRPDPYPSRLASPQTFGHTGFTGTCVWVDPAQDLVYIFLSNRVNPWGGENKKLLTMDVRGKIQDIIYASINAK